MAEPRKNSDKTAPGRENPARCCFVLSRTRMGHGLGQDRKAKINTPKKFWKAKENRRNHKIPAIIGGDYWTRTSDLLRVKQAL